MEQKAFDYIDTPLTLLDFSGSVQGNSAVLSWSTSNDINTSHFEIESSNNGVIFNKTGRVNALFQLSQYTFTDPLYFQGIFYYRLKMVDKDCACNYSNIIMLNSRLPENPNYACHN